VDKAMMMMMTMLLRYHVAVVFVQLSAVQGTTWLQPLSTNVTASEDYGMYFQISVLGKNLCLDVYGGKAYNGAEIDVWTCGGWENQLWYFKAGSDEIRFAGDPSKCIDAGSNVAQGNKLMLWDCNGLAQQKFGYDPKAHTFYLADSDEDATKCIDVTGASTTSGTPLQLWQCSGAWNQQWSVVAGLTIRIHEGGNADFCMDLVGGKAVDGTLVQLWQCDGLPNQVWYFETGSYMIKYGPDMSKCLDAGNMQEGTQLKLWTCNANYPQQKFGYDPKAQTVYLSQSRDALSAVAPQASKCIDNSGGILKNGNPLNIWSCNGCWNQQFAVTGPAAESSSDLSEHQSIPVRQAEPVKFPLGCPPKPGPAPSPRTNLYGWGCKAVNQFNWPVFKDKNALMASAWSKYFMDMYGSVPDSPYPLCTFDFWYFDVNRMKQYNVPTPTKVVHTKGKHTVGVWTTNFYAAKKWQSRLIHDGSNIVIPSHVWVEGVHSKVGTPQSGDETHGAWFFFASGSGLWLWTGKTKAFKSHKAGAQYFCGHSALDPVVAQCAKRKGFDTYTFQHATGVEIVRASGVGGYACSGPPAKANNIFKSGWTASSPCNCVEKKGYANCANGPPGTHPTASLSDSSSSHEWAPVVQV